MYADNIETIQDSGSTTEGAKGDQGEYFHIHMYSHSYCSMCIITYVYVLASSFHPIPKPYSLNPQIYFSEVVASYLISWKSISTTLWKKVWRIRLCTINVAIHTCMYICTSIFFIGAAGHTGPKGPPGQKGMKGDSGGGTVYVWWGHDQCPLFTELVYTGRMGDPAHNQAGSGSNLQCLPMDPTISQPSAEINVCEQQYMELNMKLTLTARVMFMVVINLIYHVQCAISVIILQSTWFLLSTLAH